MYYNILRVLLLNEYRPILAKAICRDFTLYSHEGLEVVRGPQISAKGLGRLPPYIDSTSSLLLFNSTENPYVLIITTVVLSIACDYMSFLFDLFSHFPGTRRIRVLIIWQVKIVLGHSLKRRKC